MYQAPRFRLASPQRSPDLQPGAHLSDHQIDDHLIGDLAADAASHLSVCPLCAERVAAEAATLSSFQSLTLAWSERQSATLPLPALSQPKPVWQRHAAWIAACFALTLGIALSSASLHTATQTAIQTAALQPAPAAIRAEQQASSQLLQDIRPGTVRLSTSHTRPARLRRAILPLPAPVETASLILPRRSRQISADNRMLQAISDEFGIPSETPSTLGIANVSDRIQQTATMRSLQD